MTDQAIERQAAHHTFVATGGWFAYFRAFFSHTVTMLIRRKRTILAGVFAMLPVLIPLFLTFLPQDVATYPGNKLFVQLTERFYLIAISPLLGLFFGCMLVGEDVEVQAIQSILVRPAPRFAIVLGRFAAYTVVSSGLLLPPLCLVFVACTTLGGISISPEGLGLLAHYLAVCVMSLMGYGAFCLFLGATARWPIIIGIAAIFGWQRLALLVPGLIDFITVEKYIRSMLPLLATEREKVTAQIAMMTYEKDELLLSPLKAAASLSVIILILLLASAFALRWREYTSAKSIAS